MTRAEPEFLAMLVHRGLLTAADAQAALASGDPERHLVDQGIVSSERWQNWLETDGGARPNLTRYELGDLIGEGGQARVFRATDRRTGDLVALKVLRPELSKKASVVNAFVAEAKFLMELDCENIVRGYRVAREGEVFFCAMELVDGVCLQDCLEREKLDEDTALEVVVQVARALSYLHARGLVHRDVKPGNILWTGDRRAVLIDLGFALQGEAGESDSTAGTVAYISPEQARGSGELDVRADIYSLGATLYHLLTGSLPFEGDTGQEIMAKQVLEALSGEAIRALGLAPQVHYFIEKMMAKDKDIRFQSPEQLIEEVTAYLELRSRETGRAGVPKKSFRRRRRR